MNTEVWKDIAGYEGKYQVSNLGRVKSLNYMHTGKEGILKAGLDRYGYLTVNLCKDGISMHKTVHRLVAFVFVEGCMDGLVVNHIDECKTNNHASNLEWCTYKQNSNHGTARKKMSIATGKPIIQYDLEGNEIARFHGAMEASRLTGVDNSSINKCCKGKLKSAGCFFWKYNKSIEREQVRALEEYNLCEHKNTKTIVING